MSQNKANILICVILILFSAALKVVTFPNSFTPIIAVSLFSGAIIKDKKMAFLMPLIAMLLSDLCFEWFTTIQGFYGWEQLGNYVALVIVTILGFSMKKVNALMVTGFSISSSILFYFLSNSSTFVFDTFNMYGNTFAEYIKCMTLGLAMLKKTIPTDLVFCIIIFGTYALLFKNQFSARNTVATAR